MYRVYLRYYDYALYRFTTLTDLLTAMYKIRQVAYWAMYLHSLPPTSKSRNYLRAALREARLRHSATVHSEHRRDNAVFVWRAQVVRTETSQAAKGEQTGAAVLAVRPHVLTSRDRPRFLYDVQDARPRTAEQPSERWTSTNVATLKEMLVKTRTLFLNRTGMSMTMLYFLQTKSLNINRTLFILYILCNKNGQLITPGSF